MTRRAVLAIAAAAPLAAKDPPLPREAIRQWVESLGDDTEYRFRNLLSPTFPGDTARDAAAFIRQSEITSSIEFLSEPEGGDVRAFSVDWYLTARLRNHAGPFVRRRLTVAIDVVFDHKKNRWLVTRLDPAAILAPLEP